MNCERVEASPDPSLANFRGVKKAENVKKKTKKTKKKQTKTTTTKKKNIFLNDVTVTSV